MHFSSKRSLPPDDKSSNATTGLRQREKDTTVSPQSPLQWLSAAATEEEEALARLIHRFVSPGNAVPDSGGGDCWRRRCLNSNSCTTSHPHQTSPTSNFSHCCPRSSHVASVSPTAHAALALNSTFRAHFAHFARTSSHSPRFGAQSWFSSFAQADEVSG